MLSEELAKMLEPDAIGAINIPDRAVQISIAVSLKRLADLFDGTTLGISVSDTVFNRNRSRE